jgi:uncharacterized protein
VRLVLDTDVLLAALLSPGLCRELLRKHLHAHTLVCSPALLREFEEKLRDKVGVEPAALPLFTAYRQRVVMVEPASLSAPVCRDPDDDLVLATALAGQAGAILTGDKDLLVLKRHAGINIRPPPAVFGTRRALNSDILIPPS